MGGRKEGGGCEGCGGGGGEVGAGVGGVDWHNVTSNPVMNLSIRNSRLQPRSAG